MQSRNDRIDLYREVTEQIISQLEQGRVPWVQPWNAARCPCMMPRNAISNRNYSGINVLILWAAAAAHGFASQRWLTFRQALQAGGNVMRGQKGTVICYADRFTPRDEADKARSENRDARTIAFLKRFVVFHVDQCEGLSAEMSGLDQPVDPLLAITSADTIIRRTGADFRTGGAEAFYFPAADYVQVPPQAAFPDPVNWYRTSLHELGHWTGHPSRLDRDQSGPFGSSAYAREELVAEMASAFTCAALGVEPTVRHADYIGSWLDVLRTDDRAIFRAAAAATKASDFLLAFGEDRP